MYTCQPSYTFYQQLFDPLSFGGGKNCNAQKSYQYPSDMMLNNEQKLRPNDKQIIFVLEIIPIIKAKRHPRKLFGQNGVILSIKDYLFFIKRYGEIILRRIM